MPNSESGIVQDNIDSQLLQYIEDLVDQKVQERISSILPEILKQASLQQSVENESKVKKANELLSTSIQILEEVEMRNNDNSVKRIFIHPISILLECLIFSIFAVITFEYVTATNEMRMNATWFYVNSNLVIVPFLTVILGLVINSVISSIQNSINKEEQLLYTKLKQAIDEATKEERIAREAGLEKERIAREAGLEKERIAREAGLKTQSDALDKIVNNFIQKSKKKR